MVIYISNDEMEKCKKIVVVGSTNVDLIARVSHLPEPGETIGDAEYCLSYGGKGANQAIAGCPEILCDDLRTSLISRRNNT